MTIADLVLEWGLCKRFAFEAGLLLLLLMLWPSAAAGFLIETTSPSAATDCHDVPAAFRMLDRIRDSDWWDRVERKLREVTRA